MYENRVMDTVTIMTCLEKYSLLERDAEILGSQMDS